jgi:hypothetical protein
MNGSGSRIWKWAAILLLLCNIGLVLTLWLKPGMQKGGPGETPRDFVIRNLHFTDDQIKQYDLLIKDHRQAMDRLRHEAMDYRKDLFGNLKSESNNANADSLAGLIAGTQKQIELVTWNHFAQVRKICTDAQKTEFDNIIGDVIKKMNGHGPPPRDRLGNPPPQEGDDNRPPPSGPDGPPPPPDGR